MTFVEAAAVNTLLRVMSNDHSVSVDEMESAAAILADAAHAVLGVGFTAFSFHQALWAGQLQIHNLEGSTDA